MARNYKKYNSILGIYDTDRTEPYNDIKEVLNKIGVMARRDKIPYASTIIPPSRPKPPANYFIGDKYYVPKDWRDCLYEDLETGHYYIVSQDTRNETFEGSWFAFRVTGLFDSIRFVETNDKGRHSIVKLNHTGTFIDLLGRCSLNEVLDTLAKNEKPITITCIRQKYNESFNCWIGVFKFDI